MKSTKKSFISNYSKLSHVTSVTAACSASVRQWHALPSTGRRRRSCKARDPTSRRKWTSHRAWCSVKVGMRRHNFSCRDFSACAKTSVLYGLMSKLPKSVFKHVMSVMGVTVHSAHKCMDGNFTSNNLSQKFLLL